MILFVHFWRRTEKLTGKKACPRYDINGKSIGKKMTRNTLVWCRQAGQEIRTRLRTSSWERASISSYLPFEEVAGDRGLWQIGGRIFQPGEEEVAMVNKETDLLLVTQWQKVTSCYCGNTHRVLSSLTRGNRTVAWSSGQRPSGCDPIIQLTACYCHVIPAKSPMIDFQFNTLPFTQLWGTISAGGQLA